MLKRYLKRRDNPWELLVMACLFLGPGIVLLKQKGPVLFPSQGTRASGYGTFLTLPETHFFGWWAVAVAAVLIGLYFYARWTADEPEVPIDLPTYEHHSDAPERSLAYGSTSSPIPVFERLKSWWKRSQKYP